MFFFFRKKINAGVRIRTLVYEKKNIVYFFSGNCCAKSHTSQSFKIFALHVKIRPPTISLETIHDSQLKVIATFVRCKFCKNNMDSYFLFFMFKKTIQMSRKTREGGGWGGFSSVIIN